MGNDLKQPVVDKLETLIQEDLDRGLAVFRSGDFEARVKAQIIKTEEGPRKRSVPLSGVPATAVVMGVLIIVFVVAAAIVFWPKRPSTLLTSDDVQALWTALDESPGVKALSGPAALETAGSKHRSELLISFERTLSLLLAQKQACENEAASGVAEQPAPPLSFRDRVRVLYHDKVIERALLLAIEKSKEA